MKKSLKITGVVLAVILALLVFMFLTPFIFRDKFAEIVKRTANKTLLTEMNFREMDVSFFHHFPNLTITLTGFSLKSSAPFSKDTLVSARDISFGVNLSSLFGKTIRINRVYLNQGRVVIQYNEKGASNFAVYNSPADTAKQADTTSKSAAIQIEHIDFIRTDFIYSDPSIPLKFVAKGINYSGNSDLSNDILKLNSRIKIDSIDLFYNHIPYLKSKPVKAELATIINMNSLSMNFEKNSLYIKNVPFEFRGELNFRKDGYTFFISLFSQLGEEYISSSLWLNSAKHLTISAKADINLDLQNWASNFGVRDLDLKGMFSLKLKADGPYFYGQNPASPKPDTVLLSIPDVSITSKLTNGYIRYKKLPQPLTGVSFDLSASTANHDYRSLNLKLENLKAVFMKNRIEGYFRLLGFEDFPVDCHLSTRMNLAEIRQVVPLDSLDLQGILDMNLNVKGKYAPSKKLFPLSQVALNLKDGVVRTKYFPQPVEKIQLSAVITNQTGNLKDTKVKLDPVSFTFMGNPFEVRANLADPGNVDYDITSKGSIDVAGLYHVFSQKGMDLKGFITTDLHLKGRQSDAMAGKVERLHNSGKLALREIAFSSDYLPLPFVIQSGVFRFENDKIWFEKFDSRYGASDITLNGHLSNIVNYVLVPGQILKGSFDFTSRHLVVDEFMAKEETAGQPGAVANASTGVIVIPSNLEVGLKADLEKVTFGKLDITGLQAGVEVKEGMLLLKEMKFNLIGCNVGMEATYGSLNPEKAFFDFHVKAEDFDIKRAYNEVELFRNLSTSAGKCEGIVSLDYTLKGKLNGAMMPVYPSLDGGGTITLKKIKVMGLKLFTAMSENLGKEKIKSPDLSKVEIKTTIKNNVITLEKTKMKISGFRLRIAGETNFNGSMNFKARLGLPPLGIVGIPIRILGTQDNPKFKYGRGNSDENVEETEYSDEIPKDMLDKIKSAKEEDLKDEPQ